MTPTSDPPMPHAAYLRIGGSRRRWPDQGTRAIMLVGLPVAAVASMRAEAG